VPSALVLAEDVELAACDTPRPLLRMAVEDCTSSRQR
jgi:hypothetical protein